LTFVWEDSGQICGPMTGLISCLIRKTELMLARRRSLHVDTVGTVFVSRFDYAQDWRSLNDGQETLIYSGHESYLQCIVAS
jgi:hypothetical protein